MFLHPAASVLVFYATSAAAGVSLVPPPETTNSTVSALGSTTTTNQSLSVTPTSSAQFPSLSGFSDCVTNCLQLSVANANCTSVVDVNCYCKTQVSLTPPSHLSSDVFSTSPRFTNFLVNCTQTSCNQEVGIAESLAQQFCFIGNASTSLSFPSTTPIPSSSSSPLPTATSSVASSTPTTPSGTSGSVTPTNAGDTVATSNAAASGFFLGSTSMASSQALGLCLAFIGFLVGAVLVE